MAATSHPPENTPHIPVLLAPLLAAVAPVAGHWLDGTFGAGGYTRGLLEAGADHVTAIDRDPTAFAHAPEDDRLTLVEGTFSTLDTHAQDLDGIVLDLGVSSMQLDQAARGFSFLRDGPLDMRMSDEGPTAADLVNGATEAEIADILFQYGEERASRKIAQAIVKARPFTTTADLAGCIEAAVGRAKSGQAHAATRSFQALRIAVNDELGELAKGLEASERALKPGGKLAVVTFHSLEDRIVKRYFAARAGGSGGNRHAPVAETSPAQFTLTPKKAIAPSAAEIAANPRARSAKLRVATRTDAPAARPDRKGLGLPGLALKDLTT